jgi:hypothetical protein
MAVATWREKRDAMLGAIARAMALDVAGSEVLADGSMGGGFGGGGSVAFENERLGARMVGGVWVDLRIGNVRSIGQDETRRDFVDGVTVPDSGLTVRRGGPRDFTLTVMIGSDDQLDAGAVGHLAGLLRTRIRRSDVLEILAGADIGLARVLNTINNDYLDADGRMVSFSMTEIRLHTIEEDVDTFVDGDTVGGDGYVATVLGDGEPDIEDIELDVSEP